MDRIVTPRRFWTLVAAAGVSLLVVASPSGSPVLARPGTVRITDREVKQTAVDVGAQGRSPGDLLVSTVLLFNKRITARPIGHAETTCTYLGSGGVQGAGSSSCSAAFFLPQGEITAYGVINSRLFYQLAVTGGTGLYDNVRGTLTVT